MTTGSEAEKSQSLLILDRSSGELLREVTVHDDGLPTGVQDKNSHANATVASDGQRIFTLFLNDQAPILTAFDLEGEQLWEQRVPGDVKIHFEYGYGSSPIVVDGLVIVAAEFNQPESGIYAFDVATGERAWMTSRPQQFSYSTPTVAIIEGQKQLLMCGNNLFSAYDVATGKELWSREGSTLATCGTMAWDQALGLGFACGGHPDRFVAAIDLSGEHEVVWQHSVKCYEQSVVTYQGFVYAVSDIGVAYCWRATDGEEMWKQRLRGNFSSSPIVIDGRIYVVNESGTTFVFEANPDAYVPLARNRLGDLAFATPAPVDGRIYHRFARGGQGYVAAIGAEFDAPKQTKVPERELSVLVVTGGHDYDEQAFQQMFASMDKVQPTFVLTEEMQALSPIEIADEFDAIIFLDMIKTEVEDDAKQHLLALTRSGVGMVFLHFTLASRPFWDEYHDLIGGKFYLPNVEKNPRLHSTYSTDMTVDARVLNSSHPVTRSMSDFQITDAFYGNVEINSKVTPLLASQHKQTSATVAWTHDYQSSRVVYMMPGFTKQAYENDDYRTFVRNAIRYVSD